MIKLKLSKRNYENAETTYENTRIESTSILINENIVIAFH